VSTNKSFMDQFARARSDFQRMPSNMQESAKVATLTYPSTRTPESKSPQQTPSRKRS
jgi:hypothetical protein